MKYCENATLSENLIHDIQSGRIFFRSKKIFQEAKLIEIADFYVKH